MDAGIDVLVFGGGGSSYVLQSEHIIPVTASYLVPMMGIADGVVSTVGCQLIAECVYAQIPMLALYAKEDGDREINAIMNKELRYKDGRRLAFESSFEALTESEILPQEVQLFMKKVLASNTSASFYANSPVAPRFDYSNELLHGSVTHAQRVFDVLDQVRAKEGCRARM